MLSAVLKTLKIPFDHVLISSKISKLIWAEFSNIINLSLSVDLIKAQFLANQIHVLASIAQTGNLSPNLDSRKFKNSIPVLDC